MTDTLSKDVVAELSYHLAGTTKADLSRALTIYAYRHGLDADTAPSVIERERRREELLDLSAAAARALSDGTLVPAAEPVKTRRVPQQTVAEMLGISDMKATLANLPYPEERAPEGADEEPEVEEV